MLRTNHLLSDIKTHFSSLQNAQNLAILGDESLFQFLLEISSFKDDYKKRFFTQKAGVLIFKKDEFITFLDTEIKDLGYTRYLNKIGLCGGGGR